MKRKLMLVLIFLLTFKTVFLIDSTVNRVRRKMAEWEYRGAAVMRRTAGSLVLEELRFLTK